MIDPFHKHELKNFADTLSASGITSDTLAAMKVMNDPALRAQADFAISVKPWQSALEEVDRMKNLKTGETTFGITLREVAGTLQATEEVRARAAAIDPFGNLRSSAASTLQSLADYKQQAGVAELEKLTLSQVNSERENRVAEFRVNPAILHAQQEWADRKQREIEALELARRQVAASEASIQSARDEAAAAKAREEAGNLREAAGAARTEKSNRIAWLGVLVAIASLAVTAWTILAPRFE